MNSQQDKKPFIDPDFQQLFAYRRAAQASGSLPEPASVVERRALVEPMLARSLRSLPVPSSDEIIESRTEIRTKDGSATITVSRFATPKHRRGGESGQSLLAPAILYVHGGGMISGSVEIWKPHCLRNVEATGVQMFAVGYRLAPENPAPGPVQDCYSALEWLSANAESMFVDPAKIILWGESAGGGIAAGAAMMARDKKLRPSLAKQILIYPMLDDRVKFGDDWPLRDHLTWSEKDNVMGWSALLGEDKAGREEVDISIYDAPGRAVVEDLASLPSTYIEVGGLDLFYSENLSFANKLLQANVEVEFHSYPGVPHAFDALGPSSVLKRSLENRKRAILQVLH
jgi:acetyl esterase/lipase